MGLMGRDVPCFPAAVVLFWWWRVLLSCGGFRGRAAAGGGGGGVVPTGVWFPPAHAWWAGVVLSHSCGRVSFLFGV